MNRPKKTLAAVAVVSILLGCATAILLLRQMSAFGVPQADGDVPARRVARGDPLPVRVRARSEPITIEPVGGLGDTVSDAQLAKALRAALPLWSPPTVPSLIHELRLWGRKADFTKAMVGTPRSGVMMLETLLNDRLCRERTTPNGASFLIDSPFGINVVRSGSMDAVDNRAEGHFGQLLMVLGEAGAALDTPVVSVSGHRGTIADILQDAEMRFRWTDDLEFVAVALALWLPPEASWTDQFGDRYSFDDLAERLMDIRHGHGACGGCHVPYALAVLLGVDRQHPILSAAVHRRALQWLSDLSALLERTQLPDGCWDKTWPATDAIEVIYDDPVLDRLTVTGHHLEWIAIAPVGVRPSPPVVQRAVSGYVDELDRLPPLRRRSFKTLLPCSHGARALCLLTNQDPFTAWMTAWSRGKNGSSHRAAQRSQETR